MIGRSAPHDDQVDSISQVLNHAKSSPLWVWRRFGALRLSTPTASMPTSAYMNVFPSMWRY
jgi:hypothetical protein